MTDLNDPFYETTRHSPKIHPLLAGSFAYVPSMGSRPAPEILLLEIYREIFFQEHSDGKAKQIDPEEANGEENYNTEERAVLYALRGRYRTAVGVGKKPFFAPAYPTLAKEAWLRKNDARIILNFLLRGPVAQCLWGSEQEMEKRKEDHEKLVRKIYSALTGHNSYRGGKDEDRSRKDILSVALDGLVVLNDEEPDDVKKRLEEITSSPKSRRLIDTPHDKLASRIFNDLMGLCTLEKQVPRLQWIQMFMSFLRFAMPMWALAHMEITILLHKLLLGVVDGVVDEDERLKTSDQLEEIIGNRNQGLLHPSQTGSREIISKVEEYTKKRIELDIFLYLLGHVAPGIKGKTLTLRRTGQGFQSVEELMGIVDKNKDQLKEISRKKHGVPTVQRFLVRESEKHANWLEPIKQGQGKNIEEFMRVLRRNEMIDELGGHLLVEERRGYSHVYRVHPGQLLLKTTLALADWSNKHEGDETDRGKQLELSDIQDHFMEYGINFNDSAEARPLLVQELQAMGLITGSPDGGEHVAVNNPYK